MKHFLLFAALVLLSSGCQTKSDLRRQQEMAQLRKELQKARGDRADVEVTVEEMKTELGRLANVLEERAQYQAVQFEAIQKEIEGLTRRIEALEQRPVPEPPRADSGGSSANGTGGETPVTFSSAKKLYDAGKFEEAIEAFKVVVRKTPKGKDKRARFWLAESYYSNKDYAVAAIEFAEFKKRYPKDGLVARATFRQGMCFKSLKKTKEAKLFFQEVIDRFPKDSFAAQAKKEMRGLK